LNTVIVDKLKIAKITDYSERQFPQFMIHLKNDLDYNEIDASTNAYWTPAANTHGELLAFIVISKNTLGHESSDSITININVTPVNDQPVIISSLSDISGNITTNSYVTSLTGKLVAMDVDVSDNLTWTIRSALGIGAVSDYGTMTIDSNTGVWVYNLGYNTAVQQLNVGQAHTDEFIATVSDSSNSSNNSDSVNINIYITGGIKNIIDFPSIIEDTSSVVITFNNILHSPIVSTSGNDFHNNGSIKSYIITAVSTDTYTLKLGLTEELAVAFDLSYNEIDASTNAYWTPVANANGDLPAFTIISKNTLGVESTESVTININVTPVNDPPVIISSLSDISGNITTNQSSITGNLVTLDVDVSDNLTWSVNGATYFIDSSYGRLSIDSSGISSGLYRNWIWTYDISNNSMTQGLYTGNYATDVFAVKVTDSSGSYATQNITINITGSGNMPSSSFTGYTWTLQTATLITQIWSSVALSNNGQYIVAVSGDGPTPGNVYTSSDYGVSWTRRDPLGTNIFTYVWKACAISSDGSKMVVTQASGYIYLSSNYGTSWTQIWTNGMGSRNWYAVSISADGSKISAVALSSHISTYNGTIWSSPLTDTSGNSLVNIWFGVSMSSDGSKIVACALSNYIYISADFGSTWKRITSAGIKNWYSISMSSDGSKLAAVENNGYIYKSSDYGITWSQTTAPLGYWLSISMSSDGSKMAAVGYNISTNNGTYVYISYDFGISWISQTSANLKLWNSVAISKDGLYIASTSDTNYISVASYPEIFTLNSYTNTNTVTTFQTINGKKYYVVQFYSNNTITMKQNIDASYIIIGGGAGGIGSTFSYGGGGGAGGSVLRGSSYLSVGNVYNVTIGNGGSVGVKGSDSSFHSIVASGGAIGTLQNGGVGVNGGGSGGNGSYSLSGSTVTPTSGTVVTTLPFTLNINGNTYTQLSNGGNGMAINGTATSTIANTGNGGGSSQSGGSGIVILYFSI
jgi:VCBS repeat-containing protein